MSPLKGNGGATKNETTPIFLKSSYMNVSWQCAVRKKFPPPSEQIPCKIGIVPVTL